MKKIFTLVLVMAMAITSFAQVKSISRKSVKAEPAQMQTFKGFESLELSNVAAPKSIMTAPTMTDLSFTAYDWQSNMGARNFTAVWPDGFAVMCFTQMTTTAGTDRGTGLAIWDPAVGEWEFTDARVEGVRTGFGSISRYKDNGLVIAAHGGSDARIFIVENFRGGDRNFGEGIILPVTTGVDPVWPVVQCSGEGLDYVNVLITNSGAATGVGDGADPIIYYQYHNGEWLHQYEMIPNLDANNLSDGGSNITYFMPYDSAKPNRVSFILNNAWSDGKLVISEDNGTTWGERVFFQHPGITEDYEDGFYYPRWTSAVFDDNDKLHIVYEWNGTSGAAGGGTYYPAMGGIAYWSEILPKNAMCVGGIGNVGSPFIIDTAYISQDLYYSEWYWSDALHDPLPEYIGELEIVDDEGNVISRESSEGNWPSSDVWNEHGSYNGGKACMPSMYKDGNRIFVFWSMIAGDSESLYWDQTNARHFFRIFCNISLDGGTTWEGTQQVITDFMYEYEEMVYGQLIPYVYTDANGDYLWYCFQMDEESGTYIQDDETVWDNNFYRAVKVYVDYMLDGVEENEMTVATMINVYPNPAQGSFNVKLDKESDVNIYNAVGQLVKTYNNVMEVNVNLEAGIYFVNAGNQTTKVVVK